MESEGPAIVKNRRPPENWPEKGSIKFSNVTMRYRPNLPLVLKSISFEIEPQEKIGIASTAKFFTSLFDIYVKYFQELSVEQVQVNPL